MTERNLEGKRVFLPFEDNIIIGEVVNSTIIEDGIRDGKTRKDAKSHQTVFHTIVIDRNSNPDDDVYKKGTTFTAPNGLVHIIDR